MATVTRDPVALSPARPTPRPKPAGPLRVAVAGAGYIAGYHLDILRKLGSVEVVGACDPSTARLDTLCRQWSIPHRAAGLAELLRLCQPQVLHVLVPPAFHADVAAEALAAGLHVLVEKPLVLQTEDYQRLAILADKQGVALGVNHNAVFHPLVRRLKRDLAAGKLGRVEHVVAHQHTPLGQLEAGEHDHWMFRDPVNVLFEQGPHPLSQVCELLGGVRRAAVLTSDVVTLRTGASFAATWQAALECDRGTAQLLLAFRGSFPEWFLHVVGQDGTAHLDLLHGTYLLDRRTRYLEAIDRGLRLLRRAAQTTAAAAGGLFRYGLSTLRLTGRSDPYYLGMRDSIAAFYHGLQQGDIAANRENARQVTEGLECIASAVRSPGPIVSPSPVPATPRRQGGEILVLGGTGFIGRHVVAALAAAGRPVRLLVRRPTLVPAFPGEPPAVLPGDVRNADDVRRAVVGCQAVIHLVTGAPEGWPAFEELFLHATRRVAEACVDAGVEQFLYASSIAAYYLGRERDVITEDTPLDDPDRRSPYPRAKILAERLLADLHRTRGLPVTVFRPGVVVGAGGPVEHLGVGFWPGATHCVSWSRRVRGPLPFVLAADVATALVAALGRPELVGSSFNLVGDVRLSAAEYVEALRRLSGRDVRLHRQSVLKWMLIDGFKWLVKAAARKPDNRRPGWHDAASNALAARFDCSRARTVLGWQPVADREAFLELGIRAALAARGDA